VPIEPSSLYFTRFSLLKVLIVFLAYKKLHNVELWTSGTDTGCPGNYHWCSISRKMTNRKLAWSKEGGGNCVSIKFSNGSTFSKAECGEKRNYVCEVFRSQKIHQEKCLLVASKNFC
jgi:hypothetical protein